MINSFNIQNFQSHKNTKLKLNPGLNVIVGSSDSGKTAIVRAINWVLRNRPSGEAFRSHWGGETLMELNLNGIKVSRVRDKDNLYYADGVKFEAIKTEVPFEVQHILNMDEVNLQSQFDLPFLITATPGEVAKHFNKVAQLDDIDTSLKNINTWINSINREQKVRESDLKIAEEDIKEYDHLEKFEAEVEDLESLDNQYNNLYNAVIKLKNLKAEIESINNEIIYQKEITKDENLVNNILELTDQIEQKEQERAALRDVLDTINAIDIALNREQTDLKTLEKKYEIEFPEICPFCNTDLSGKNTTK